MRNLRQRLRLRRRLAALRDPKLRFNCADQSNPSWDERARIAADLMTRLSGGGHSPGRIRVADLGCGNERLAHVLAEVAPGLIDYRGFDRHPQSPRVERLDVRKGLPDEHFDIVFCLGLLEYLDGLEAFVQRLARTCSAAVVSYVIADAEGALPSSERRVRGWLTDLTADEVEDLASRSGFEVVESAPESDGFTRLFALRSTRSATTEGLAS